MDFLRQNIKSGNISYIQKIDRELQLHLKRVQLDAFSQAPLRIDHHSTSLIPDDIASFIWQKRGNQDDCLFNFISLFLRGDELLAECLHMLTWCQLHQNAN